MLTSCEWDLDGPAHALQESCDQKQSGRGGQQRGADLEPDRRGPGAGQRRQDRQDDQLEARQFLAGGDCVRDAPRGDESRADIGRGWLMLLIVSFADVGWGLGGSSVG